MKILFANNFCYLRGGSERVLFDELEMLASRGLRTAVFSRHFEKNISTEYQRFFPSKLEYENVSLINKILASGTLVYSFESKNGFDKLMAHFQPDIVHAHNIYGRLTTSIIDASKLKRIPVVMTLHDYKLICPSYLMLRKGIVCERCKGGSYYHCLLTRCHKDNLFSSAIYTFESYVNVFKKKYDWITHFITPSKFSLSKHAENGIPEKKLVHVPNFVKTDNIVPNYSAGDYILFVGRLSKEKGVLTLLQAIRNVEVQVRVVGDGPMRAEYEKFAEENGLGEIVFEGYKTGDHLNKLFRNAAFLVFPSEWLENAPMTILEAFAYGKPVVASNIGGIPEMVVENETGLLFNTGNHEELRERIEYLISNPSEVLRMGKNARERVEKEYNAEIHYERLMDVYQKALS